MKPRSLGWRAGWAIGLVAVAVLLAVWVRSGRSPAPAPTAAESAEAWGGLEHIPTIDVVRDAALAHLLPLTLDDEGEHAAALAQISALDPDIRALLWLCWLDDGWGRDGLHTFFLLSAGDFAPQVLEALRHAQLEREAAVFAEAMALFGPHYPADQSVREKPFAWSQPGRQLDAVTTQPNAPNAFDRALAAKATAFGTRSALAQRIADYVERTPTLQAWAEKARAELSDEQRLDWLLSQLSVRSGGDARAEIANWPAPYRQLILLNVFMAEVLNGGVHQFFYNSSGDLAPQVALALEEAGLPDHAATLRRALDQFGTPYPADNGARRASHFSKAWSDWDEALNAFTEEFDDGTIVDKMMDIAQRGKLLPQ